MISGISELHRRHWIGIGLVLGVMLGGSQLLWRDPVPQAQIVLRQHEFERDLVRQHSDNAPRLRDLVVHPLHDGVNFVTGERVRSRRGEVEVSRFVFPATVPYTSANIPAGALPAGATVLDYLEHVKAQHPSIEYRYAWHRRRSLVMAAWTIGAVLVVGGLWPMIVNMLIAAGYAPPRKPPEEKIDLSRYKSHPEPSAQPPAPAPTQADVEQLRKLEAELEQKLSAGPGSAPADNVPATDADAPARPLRQLTASPLEGPRNATPQEEKDYAGEFYPTVAHAPKKRQEDS